MIIEKNMNVKIKLDSDLVAEYFKECLKDSKELSDIADKIDDNILSYLSAFYIGKLERENPEQYAKFIKFLPRPENKENDVPQDPYGIRKGDLYFVNSKEFLDAVFKITLLDNSYFLFKVTDIDYKNETVSLKHFDEFGDVVSSLKLSIKLFRQSLNNRKIIKVM